MSAAVKTVDIAKLTHRASTPKRYTVPARALRGDIGDGTSVVTGALATGKLAGEESLVHENGTAQSALPLAVVLVAIRDGIIPRATVEALLAASK